MNIDISLLKGASVKKVLKSVKVAYKAMLKHSKISKKSTIKVRFNGNALTPQILEVIQIDDNGNGLIIKH